jgi:hypothetical protein
MWGSSPDDLWLVGTGSPITNLFWHFNGSIWKKDSVARPINPLALWGFSRNNIWLVNSGPEIWHYNGNDWYEYTKMTPPEGFQTIYLNNIWGRKSNDIWAVGGADQLNEGNKYKGIILHFNGSKWKYTNIPETRIGYIYVYQQQSSKLYFLTGRSSEASGDTDKVFVYDGKSSMKEIFSSSEYSTSLTEIDGEVYFINNRVIYKYSKNKLKIWKDFSNTNYRGSMIGRSEKDFFCIDRDSNIIHYNGSNLEIVYKTNLFLTTYFIFKKDVFFVLQDRQNDLTMVLHGTLQ